MDIDNEAAAQAPDGPATIDMPNATSVAAPAPAPAAAAEGSESRKQPGAASLNHGQPLRGSFTSCIVAAPAVSPGAAWHWLSPFLAPSASFAFFSPCMQPLAEFMHSLQHSKEAVALQLHDIWWREYQVLPFRTHPEMNASQPGGFIVTGIKIGS